MSSGLEALTDKTKEIEINFTKKATEAEWLKVADTFYLHVTPVWFSWLGWIFLLAGLEYICDHTESFAPNILRYLSYFLLIFYFFAVFARFNLKGIPLISNDGSARFVSIALTSFTASLAWFMASTIAREIAKFQ